MKTLGQVLKLSCDYLQSKSSSHSRHEVEELIAYTLGMKRLDLYLAFDKPLNEEELGKIRKNLGRLAANEPIQYIEGKVQFYDCSISVDKRVLIPRPETEILVDYIAKKLQSQKLENKVLWDICTGSGCIGIALKKALPELTVTISDLSSDALDVACKNCKENEVSIEALQGDLLEPFGAKKADFIVCNPPYGSEDEFDDLKAHVKDFEPKGAIIAGKSGLECYERLIKQIPTHTNGGAWVWLEISPRRTVEICQWLVAMQNVRVMKDFAGSDRFIEFQIPSYSNF